MRTPTTAQERALQAYQRGYHCRVEIEDGSASLVDWSNIFGDGTVDLIQSVQISESVDDRYAVADLELRFRYWDNNASPYVTGSRWEDYVNVGRRLIVYVACLPGGVPPTSANLTTYEVLLFDGAISEFNLTDNQTVNITARDRLGAVLADRWVEEDTEYGTGGGRDLEDVIDDILGDWTDSPPTVITPVTPNWALTTYNQEVTDVLDAIGKLVDQIGWDFRPRWYPSSSAFRWHLTEPDRTATSGDETWTFEVRDIAGMSRAGVSLESIRNVIDIWYDGGSTGTDGAPEPSKVTRQDASSIAAYGRRWMQVTEGSSSNIDSQAQAERMGDAILADLKDPSLDADVELALLFWPVEIGDFYKFEPDGFRFGAAQYLAVTSYTHRIGAGEYTTSLSLTGKPRGGRVRWLDMLAHPAKAPTRNTSTPPSVTVVGTTIANGVDLIHSLPASLQWDYIEVHRSTSNGFTPSSATLYAISRSNRFVDLRTAKGQTYYYKSIVKSFDRNEGAASTQISADARGLEVGDVDDQYAAGSAVYLSTDSTGAVDGDKVPLDTVRLGASSYLSSNVVTPPRNVYQLAARVGISTLDNCSGWRVALYHNASSPTLLWTSETVDAAGWLPITRAFDGRARADMWLELELDDSGGTASVTVLAETYLDLTPTLWDPSIT